MIYRCDVRKENYSQINNIINPYNTCNSTSMIQALDYAGFRLPDDRFIPEFKQPEDKFTYFCLTDKDVIAFYKNNDLIDYTDWIREKEEIKKVNPNMELKDYRWNKSYPPNEVHIVLNYAANLFLYKFYKTIAKQDPNDLSDFYSSKYDYTRFDTVCSKEEIIEKIKKHEPLVCSVKFGSIPGHLLTIVGMETDKKGKPVKIIVDDTYGRYNMKKEKYDQKGGGNDCIFGFEEFFNHMKPIEKNSKWIHTFNINNNVSKL